MSKNRKPESFIKLPVYPGGHKALSEFIRQNRIYPEEAIKNKIEGTVSVEYDVDVFGKVVKISVKHGIGYGCDEEASRLVRLLKYPKHKYQGLHVLFHMKIHIHFRLSMLPKPKQEEQEIVYSYVEKKKEGKQDVGYTVKVNTSQKN